MKINISTLRKIINEEVQKSLLNETASAPETKAFAEKLMKTAEELLTEFKQIKNLEDPTGERYKDVMSGNVSDQDDPVVLDLSDIEAGLKRLQAMGSKLFGRS